jgi:hypothetical protein
VERSVRPVVALTLTYGGQRLTYAGSAFSEGTCAETVREWIADSDAVVLGASGPKLHPVESIPVRAEQYLLCTTEEVLRALAQDNAPMRAQLAECQLYCGGNANVVTVGESEGR